MDKKVMDTLVENGLETADGYYSTITDRIIERMKQKESNMTADVLVAGRATEKIANMVELVNEELAEHIAGRISGKKYDFKSNKASAISLIDRLVGIADEYYEIIVDRILEKMNQTEENIDRDKEVAKKVAEQLIEGAEKHADILSDEIAKKLSSK